MKAFLVHAAAAALVSVSGNACAQTKPAELHIKQLAASCASCHGTNGAVVSGSPVVGLAGYDERAMIAAMAAFKAGTRPATIMHQLSKGYTDEQVAQLAAHFANLKK